MNNSIFFFLYNFAHKSILVDYLIIFTADILPYLVILAAIIFMLAHHDVLKSKDPMKAFIKKWREILLVFFSSATAWFLSYVLKYAFHTSRPFVVFSNVHSLVSEYDYAFPSGHATSFMALAISIFLIHKRAGYVFITFAILIGIARIMAGVHFPSDVLGGWVLGVIVGFIINKLS